MPEHSAKQALIERRRREFSAQYPGLWANIITSWQKPDGPDRAYLTYAANYLFITAGTHWAIDPLILANRISDISPMDVSPDLQWLAFVLLTHRHTDHLDIDLLRSLRSVPITWVVPVDVVTYVREKAGIAEQNIIVPENGRVIYFNGIAVLPFDGLHWELVGNDADGKPIRKGIPSMGYLVRSNGKSWLFPGDVRGYENRRMPSFDPVDVVFAHLWLGRHCAQWEDPPLLDAFCNFYVNLKPQRIVVTHLEEVGRKDDDYWDMQHFEMVKAGIHKLAPDIEVQVALTGDQIHL